MSKSFYEIHFTGEGFRRLDVYQQFFRAALRDALKRRADYDAEVRDWYENGDGRPVVWDVDANGHQYNAGGQGHTFPHCIHGTSLWTDYDNICGWCEDGSTAIEEAIVYGREAFLRFVDRWEWATAAPGDLPYETRCGILEWAMKCWPFPPKGD